MRIRISCNLFLFCLTAMCGVSISFAQSDTLWSRFIENQFWKSYGVTADDSVVLAGDQDGRFYKFNAETGSLLSEEFLCEPFIGGQIATSNIVFSISRGGGRISASLDTVVRFYNYPGFELVRQLSASSLNGPKSKLPIGRAILSDDGTLFFTARGGHTQIRNVETDSLFASLPDGHRYDAGPILSPGNQFVVFAERSIDSKGNNVNATLHVFEVQGMTEVLTVNFGNGLIPSGLDFSFDGKYLAYSDARDREASSEVKSHVVIFDMDSLKSIDSSASTSINTSTLRFIHTNQGYQYTRAYFNDSVTNRGMALMEVGVESILMAYPDRLGYFSFSGKVFIEIRGQYLLRRMLQLPSPVDEDTMSETFNLFPNPTEGSCEFSGLQMADGSVHWELVSIDGATVARGETAVEGSRGRIKFNGVDSRGSYFLRLYHNGKVVKTTIVGL